MRIDRNEDNCRTEVKRPKSLKVAMTAKKVTVEMNADEVGFKDALYFLAGKFEEVSSAKRAVASAWDGELIAQVGRKDQVKKNANKLEVARVLFNDDDVESKMYRNALKKKKYQ